MKVKITADSSCDLPKYITEEYDIGITPLSIVKGGVPYKDGLEITPQDIYDYVESDAGACHTTAVNAQEYYDNFSECLKEYDAVIHVNIGANFSACNQNANIAASEMQNVYVIDSENLSMGQGYIAWKAAKMAKDGAEPEEIIKWSDSIKGKLDVSFVIDTIKYLYKGGRCSALAALGANVLGLKPCIEVRNGLMGVGKKYRGSTVKIAEQFTRDKLSCIDEIDKKDMFVFHSGLSQEILQTVHRTIEGISSFDETYEGIVGCTISNHCGPNTLGLLTIKK